MGKPGLRAGTIVFNTEQNQYECVKEGGYRAVLPFKGEKTDSIHKEHYDRMHRKLMENAAYAKRMSKIRSKTVEPVLGTLINFTNMKRVNTRGIERADKHVLVAALTYNLKKHLKFVKSKSHKLNQRNHGYRKNIKSS